MNQRKEIQDRISRLHRDIRAARERGNLVVLDQLSAELAYLLLSHSDEIAQARGVRFSPQEKINSIHGGA